MQPLRQYSAALWRPSQPCDEGVVQRERCLRSITLTHGDCQHSLPENKTLQQSSGGTFTMPYTNQVVFPFYDNYFSSSEETLWHSGHPDCPSQVPLPQW